MRQALAEALDATVVEELGGGHQSQVFRVLLPGGVVAVAKLFDASVARAELDTRLAVVTSLAELEAPVCRPVPVAGRLVTELEGSHVACFERAEGRAPDPASAADAELMGAALAELHAVLRAVPPVPLPLVAALRDEPPDAKPRGGPVQLLHGDFNASNLRVGEVGLRMFDFDDCGYGPPLFDVANAIYMVRFDAVVEGSPTRFSDFERSFVASYAAASGAAVPGDVLQRFVDRRVDALAGWIDDLVTAPIGIRTASVDWLATLRSFVESYRSTT
jgi:Ser/Thr protein kinase RdoA (MazF antagonist)